MIELLIVVAGLVLVALAFYMGRRSRRGQRQSDSTGGVSAVDSGSDGDSGGDGGGD